MAVLTVEGRLLERSLPDNLPVGANVISDYAHYCITAIYFYIEQDKVEYAADVVEYYE